MTTGLLLFLGLALLGGLPALYLYLKGEPPVPGRAFFLGLRLTTVLILAILLVNPSLPGTDGPEPEATRWMLIDGTRALDLPDEGGQPVQVAVLDRAQEATQEGARLALLGANEPEGVDILTLQDAPRRPSIRNVHPSLLRLAEAGADSIVLVSPFRMTFSELTHALDGLPAGVGLEQVGGPVRNAGILELELPRRVPAGDPVEGSVLFFGEGGEPNDSVLIRVEARGEVVTEELHPLPPPGQPARATLQLPPEADTGTVRYSARAVLEGDIFSADDHRVGYVRVGPPEGGILLVSLSPDWEPRVLLPVLESVSGLPGEGYLQVAADRWLVLGEGSASPGPVESQIFRDRLGQAGLLVVHGVDSAAPEWLEAAVQTHPRIIHLPAGQAGAALASLSPAGARPGEWSPVAELPPSPVAPYLAELPLANLPPLTDLRPAGMDGGTAALAVRPPGGGDPLAALILREGEGGRSAVALARGFWRWGHRGGPAREAYRALWAGVASWILSPEAPGPEGRIRSTEPVVSMEEASEWEALGQGGRILELSFFPQETGAQPSDPGEASGSPVHTRRVTLDERGRGYVDPLPSGQWVWHGEVVDPLGPDVEGETAVVDTGMLEVEPWSGALVHPPLDSLPDPSDFRRDGEPIRTAGGGGRPLRTHPLPYLLLIVLLSLEWVGRRRAGLR